MGELGTQRLYNQNTYVKKTKQISPEVLGYMMLKLISGNGGMTPARILFI